MSDYPSQPKLFGMTAAWAIGVFALILALSAAGWGISVAVAPTKGKGGAFKQKESANNRVFQQANFVQLNEDFQGYLAKIDLARSQLSMAGATSEEKQVAQANLAGAQQICIDTAQQYNADSQKYLARDFKSAGLPYRLEPKECATS